MKLILAAVASRHLRRAALWPKQAQRLDVLHKIPAALVQYTHMCLPIGATYSIQVSIDRILHQTGCEMMKTGTDSCDCSRDTLPAARVCHSGAQEADHTVIESIVIV